MECMMQQTLQPEGKEYVKTCLRIKISDEFLLEILFSSNQRKKKKVCFPNIF